MTDANNIKFFDETTPLSNERSLVLRAVAEYDILEQENRCLKNRVEVLQGFLNAHIDRVVHLSNRLRAVAAMHRQVGQGEASYCDYCRESWPCATMMILEHPSTSEAVHD